MTPLRSKMIEDMQLRRFSLNTQESYLRSVTELAKHYNKSPDCIRNEQLKEYVLFLTNEKNLCWRSINNKTSGIRFLFENILNRKDVSLAIPPRKTPRQLPEILGADELVRLFESVNNIHLHRIYRHGQKLPGKMHRLRRHSGRGRRPVYHRHGYDQSPRRRRGRSLSAEKTSSLSGAGGVGHRRGRISSLG